LAILLSNNFATHIHRKVEAVDFEAWKILPKTLFAVSFVTPIRRKVAAVDFEAWKVLPKPLFAASLGAYLAVLVVANHPSTEAFSPKWFACLPMLWRASMYIGKSVLPCVTGKIAISDALFPTLFGVHVFSATALPLLTSILVPHLPNENSVKLLFASMAMMTIGAISEIIGHFYDRWVFSSGGHAADGIENVIFSVCLNGGFSFLAAAFFPTTRNIALACIPPAFLALLPTVMPWQKGKKFVYGSQTITAGLAAAAFGVHFRSAWPALYFVQAFNIIRNGGRILSTGIQGLHIMPSAVGWFSYMAPFGLAIHPATRSASVPIVALVSILTILGTDQAERYLMAHPKGTIKSKGYGRLESFLDERRTTMIAL
jgi:hypothetical protein